MNISHPRQKGRRLIGLEWSQEVPDAREPLHFLWRLPFSSAYCSLVTAILQRLPFSCDCHFLATAILQRLPFSCDCQFLATAIL